MKIFFQLSQKQSRIIWNFQRWSKCWLRKEFFQIKLICLMWCLFILQRSTINLPRKRNMRKRLLKRRRKWKQRPKSKNWRSLKLWHKWLSPNSFFSWLIFPNKCFPGIKLGFKISFKLCGQIAVRWKFTFINLREKLCSSMNIIEKCLTRILLSIFVTIRITLNIFIQFMFKKILTIKVI